MIKVNDFSIPYHEGITLLDVLKEANTDINGPVLVTVGGVFVGIDSYKDTLLKDGDEVLTMRVVSGG
ncbi:MAG: MoaD/ThiS family protein [Lachnospiraceae bacterium]|nr:MoaD/ThiS family protein [Lachnospiraceae bacterium]